ncbi:MAG: GspE/PulE family protein, partial [Candidatus Omnitrophica bacterium]|nr:GspE/PulE family protein [Candidatus Omnitrophota bacterium]
MERLGQNIISILTKSNKINPEDLQRALKIQKEKNIPLRKVLIEEGIISEEELLLLFSTQLFIPTFHLDRYHFHPEIVKIIPERLARFYNVIALSQVGKTLTVAISDPLNILALDDLRTLTGFNIEVVLSPEEEIKRAIDKNYSVPFSEIESISPEEILKEDSKTTSQEEIKLTDVVHESQKPPIIKLVDLILMQALKQRASDIHIEPEETSVRVRYRIDGILHERYRIPKQNQGGFLARLKIISDLDITENRLPQDGRFKVKFEEREVDFRVSALPTTFGQKFVLRILDKTNLSVGLDNLGFSEDLLRIFKEAISKPYGMILVTGPTGSGKSTTLYSVLNQLNTPERHIVTIEDPVEYEIKGITQIQVKPEIGLTFANGLRSILRQSPDIIMVGEIRDSETADIAVKASLTGQLVFSTLHTNDALSSITRLIDMGIEPFLVASSLVMVSAQRLCRKICPRCKTKIEISKEYLENIGFREDADLFAGRGCR